MMSVEEGFPGRFATLPAMAAIRSFKGLVDVPGLFVLL
jgi:hypothetical protein